MDFNAWWYDYKIKNGLLSHVDRYKPHVQAAWDAAQAARGDVPRQQIAGVVILDYDYEGDALAGVHHGGCGAAGRMDKKVEND